MSEFKSPFNTLSLPEVEPGGLLSFNLRNAKLGKNVAAFSLPAGYTCPGACDCLAWFDRDERKLHDGPESKFRCFAATLEARPNVSKSVDRNLALLKRAETAEAIAELIDLSLPGKAYDVIRVHADGDFYHQNYFLGWMEAARRNPGRLFYAYTKSLPIWVKFRNLGFIPDNFVLTASEGGKWDAMIEKHDLRYARVVFHPEEAETLGFEIDHDDSLAQSRDGKNFALLLHGMQAKDTEASAAIKRMKDEDIKFSYTKNKTKHTVTV